jgi:hypothetical protein
LPTALVISNGLCSIEIHIAPPPIKHFNGLCSTGNHIAPLPIHVFQWALLTGALFNRLCYFNGFCSTEFHLSIVNNQSIGFDR